MTEQQGQAVTKPGATFSQCHKNTGGDNSSGFSGEVWFSAAVRFASAWQKSVAGKKGSGSYLGGFCRQ